MNKILRLKFCFIAIVGGALLSISSCTRNDGIDGHNFGGEREVTFSAGSSSFSTKGGNVSAVADSFVSSLYIGKDSEGDSLYLNTYQSNMDVDDIATKLVPITTSSIINKPFGVIAYTHTAEQADTPSSWKFYAGSKVEYSSGVWLATPSVYWPGKDAVSYFGYWPQSATGLTVATPADNTAPTATFKVTGGSGTALENNQVDFLIAKSGSKAGNPNIGALNVALSFKHVLSGIRFKCDEEINVTNVEISGSSIKNVGTYNMHTGEWSGQTVSGSDNSYTLSSISYDAAVGGVKKFEDKHTLFLLPQEFTDDNAQITVTIENKATPVTVSLKGHKWESGKCITYLISNTGGGSSIDPEAEYFFDVSVPSLSHLGGTATAQVVSYKVKNGTTTNLDWSTDGKLYPTYEDAVNSTNASTTSFVSSYSPTYATSPSSGQTTVSITYTGATVQSSQTLSGSVFDSKISNTPQSGNPTSYHNLANPGNPSSYNIAESANTYIVNGKGYYRIPLVMGNGVKNDKFNTFAYKQAGFADYKGNQLNSVDMSPYLQDNGRGKPTSAEIVWANRAFFAHDGSYNLVSGSTTVNLITTAGNSAGKEVYWLNFNVNDATAQGIGVIAVKDENGTIMWSYTIWLTDYVPFNYPNYSSSTEQDIEVTSYTDASNPTGTPLKVTFMPRNLGWIDQSGNYLTGDRYPGAVAYVKVTQTESGDTKIMQISRPEVFTQMSGARSGYSPYYQWGRKDALLPSNGTGNANLSAVGKNASLATASSTTLANVIKGPHTFYYNTSTYDWTTSTGNNGWWCAGNTSTSVDLPTVKTIYDPSPAGYTIPRYNAYLSFRTGTSGSAPNSTNEAFSSVKGYYFYTGYRATSSASTDGMGTIFFPAAGYRGYSSGGLGRVGSVGYYWSAVPYSASYGHHLDFHSGYVFPQGSYNRYYGFSVRVCRQE